MYLLHVNDFHVVRGLVQRQLRVQQGVLVVNAEVILALFQAFLRCAGVF